MYTHFRIVRCPMDITPPKWDEPLISQKEPDKIHIRCNKGSTQEHMYMVCNPTYTYLITKDKQVGSTTYTNICKAQNHHMQGGK